MPYLSLKLVNCCKQQVVALECYLVRAKLRTKGISLQVQVVLIFAVDNSNMNVGNVTKLHTFAKHRTEMISCILIVLLLADHRSENDNDRIQP